MLIHTPPSISLLVHNHRTFILMSLRYIIDSRNRRHRSETQARLSENYICELKLKFVKNIKMQELYSTEERIVHTAVLPCVNFIKTIISNPVIS
jgi:predicted RNA-binding protein Jag